jgi:hypothetical protein
MRRAVTMLAIVVAGVVSAETSDYRGAAQEYLASLNRLLSHAPDTSVEDVYSRAALLGEALLYPPSALESMPEVEFQALRRQMPGFILNREEVLIAGPEPSYFLDLAGRHGRPVDRRFFIVQSHGRPDGVWPVYMQQQTDHSGCTLFGQGKLVASYRSWRDFRSEFPRAYARFVTQALADIEEQVARSTCACGDADSVSRELTDFATAFPESAVAAAAASRARAAREYRSPIRFKCLSG